MCGLHWLREQGHDATHLRDEGLQRLPDAQIFEKASNEQRVLLTFDLDFAEIAALIDRHSAAVIVFRLHNTRAPHVISRIEAVLKASATALQRSVIVTVEESRHRIRYLPIGTI